MRHAKLAEMIEQSLRQLEAIRSELSGDMGTDAQGSEIARQFARMDDDHQAKFFVEVAKHMNGWGAGKMEQQLYSIGKHLRTCECSTPEAIELVTFLARCTQP